MYKSSKIGIIVPYFGKWPEWITYFMLSCKYNPNIDWLFFTDCRVTDVKAKNIIFHQMQLHEFNKIVKEKLEIRVNIKNPYKICDLRPAFGKIFSDYLDNYDFWGYGDIDLIYGNFNHFISQKDLEKFDIISPCKNYLCGHLALYRNNTIINNLYQMGHDYKKILGDSHYHYAFDERSRIIGKKLFNNKKYIGLKYIYSYFEHFSNKVKVKLLRLHKDNRLRDMTAITEYAARQNIITLLKANIIRSDEWFLKQKITTWKFVWDEGRLIERSTNNEFLYFHFLKSKNRKNFEIQKWKSNKRFLITNKGILIPDL